MMKAFKEEKLNPDVADVLYELGNMGVGQASIALGKILGVGITIGIPRVVQADMRSLPFEDKDAESLNIGILMIMEITFGGIVLFLVNKDFISNVLFKLTGKRCHGSAILEDEECFSATQELANIMAASYVKVIGAYAGTKLYLHPAMVGVDTADALISFAMKRFNLERETAVFVDTSFGMMNGTGRREKELGRIIMIPDDASVKRIMEKLDIKLEEE